MTIALESPLATLQARTVEQANPILLEELDHIAYMQQEGVLPKLGVLKKIGQKPGMEIALEGRLRTSLDKDKLDSNDYLRILESARLFATLAVKPPDQYATAIPALVKKCEQHLDSQGIEHKPKTRGVVRRKALQFGGAAAGITALAGFGKAAKFAYDVMNTNPQAIKSYVKYDTSIFRDGSLADKYKQGATQVQVATGEEVKAEQAEPAVEEPPVESIAEPVAEPEEPQGATPDNPEEIVGDANMAEFFLGDLLNLFKYRRQERILFEPGAKERLMPALVSGDQITFLYLGFDETRERYKEFAGDGKGRSDVIILVSINPHTLQMIEVTIPRDTTTPGLRGNKINAMTAGIFPGDVLDISRTMVEQLTGVPIDAVIQTNIDTVKGFNGIRNNQWGSEHPGVYYPGIFDVLAPDGLVMNVPKAIVDNEYPVGYAIKRLVIPAGPQRMNGEQLTEYARSRHQDMDFGRSSNQRDVMFALFKVLAVDGRDYLLSGDNRIFDKINLFISFLEREEQNGDIHYNEVNFTQIVRTIQEAVTRLRNDPQGKAILSKVALNSIPAVSNLLNNSQSVYTSYGPSFENGMLTPVAPGDTQLKLVGSSMNSSPIEYSQPLRRKVKELFGIS